jgi:hypothetical protein
MAVGPLHGNPAHLPPELLVELVGVGQAFVGEADQDQAGNECSKEDKQQARAGIDLSIVLHGVIGGDCPAPAPGRRF